MRVNVVSPGNIWTPLWKSWSDGEPDPVAAKEAGDRVQVMQRKGTIEETGRVRHASFMRVMRASRVRRVCVR